MARSQVKPFTVERKSKSRKPPTSAGLFDEAIAFDEVPARDINADIAELPDEGRDAAYEEAMRAADSVFGDSPKAAAPSGPEQPERTVLQDLTYVDPLQERLAKAAAVKRGRKPGSKNRPKPPPTIAPAAPPADGEIAPALFRRPVVRSGRPYLGFIAALEARRALRPGERWKLKVERQVARRG